MGALKNKYKLKKKTRDGKKRKDTEQKSKTSKRPEDRKTERGSVHMRVYAWEEQEAARTAPRSAVEQLALQVREDGRADAHVAELHEARGRLAVHALERGARRPPLRLCVRGRTGKPRANHTRVSKQSPTTKRSGKF